jgi:crooked neck
VYAQALRIVPHKLFSFSSLWVMFAQFEVRCKNIDAARSILGNAIGRAPKSKIFDAYITLEMQLGNMERCRAIYEKYEPAPSHIVDHAW